MIIDLLSAIDTLNSIKALLAESIRTQLDLKKLEFPCRLGDLNLRLIDTNLYRVEKIGVSNIETRDFSELNLETLISLHSQLDLIKPAEVFYSVELLVKKDAQVEAYNDIESPLVSDYASDVIGYSDSNYSEGLRNAQLIVLSESKLDEGNRLIATGNAQLDLELIKLHQARIDKFAIYLE